MCAPLPPASFPLITLKAMAHKLGSAPSQYFQGDGAKPRAQSHNLSYNSTGWVASAVLVNTLFHSVCLLISHLAPPFSPHMATFLILICVFMSWFWVCPKYMFATCLYSLFFHSFKIFSSHHYFSFIFGLVLPLSSSPAPTCVISPFTHLILVFMVSQFQSFFQGWNGQQLIYVVMYCAAFDWGFGLLCFTAQVL